MHSGVPRKLSGGSSSRRRARTKDRDEMTRDAARVTWSFRAGVGSSSRRKLIVSHGNWDGWITMDSNLARQLEISHANWRNVRLSKFKYESYPIGRSASCRMKDSTELFDVA
jgi:hypothetical protein